MPPATVPLQCDYFLILEPADIVTGILRKNLCRLAESQSLKPPEGKGEYALLEDDVLRGEFVGIIIDTLCQLNAAYTQFEITTQGQDIWGNRRPYEVDYQLFHLPTRIFFQENTSFGIIQSKDMPKYLDVLKWQSEQAGMLETQTEAMRAAWHAMQTWNLKRGTVFFLCEPTW